MVELTRFDGSRIFVNADYIEFVETTPDTVLSLVDHKKLLVKESAREVVERIIAYRARIAPSTPAFLTRLEQMVHHQDHEDDRILGFPTEKE